MVQRKTACIGLCLFILSSFCLLFLSCAGSPDFSGSSDMKPMVPPPQLTMNWLWNCEDIDEDSGKGIEVKGNDLFFVRGGGKYSFPVRPESIVTLNISGSFCPPAELPRDIVFIIDVSGSMETNDPATASNTCGRYDAIEAAISNLATTLADEADGSQFAIITFSKDIVSSSSKFIGSKKDLYADITKTGTIQSVLCDHKTSTNYDAALKRAEELFLAGRSGATKEIYFISDGEPDGSADGIMLANKLKKQGVVVEQSTILATIATIMLKGSDRVLEHYIASRDENQNAMHAKVDNVDELADVLAELAINELKETHMKFKFIADKEWQEFDLPDPATTDEFSIPSMDLTVAAETEGIEVIYQYLTSRNMSYECHGTIKMPISEDVGE